MIEDMVAVDLSRRDSRPWLVRKDIRFLKKNEKKKKKKEKEAREIRSIHETTQFLVLFESLKLVRFNLADDTLKCTRVHGIKGWLIR